MGALFFLQMLYLIGLGLDVESVSVEAKRIIKSQNLSHVFLEKYTASLIDQNSLDKLNEILERDVEIVYREFMEEGAKKILELAKNEKMVQNRSIGAHTLCLLDIKVKEKTIDAVLNNTDEVKPDYFMTVNEACIQVLKFIEMAKCE